MILKETQRFLNSSSKSKNEILNSVERMTGKFNNQGGLIPVKSFVKSKVEFISNETNSAFDVILYVSNKFIFIPLIGFIVMIGLLLKNILVDQMYFMSIPLAICIGTFLFTILTLRKRLRQSLKVLSECFEDTTDSF